MKYDQTIITPKGLTVHIRNGVASDGSTVLENFNLTHAETDYLLSYPDENHFDAEQESRYLEKKETSPNEIELIAFVNGKVAGTAGIEAIGAHYKVAHRAEFGISILKEYWGLGIGRALMEACIQCARTAGYAQLELDVVAENARAISMYQDVKRCIPTEIDAINGAIVEQARRYNVSVPYNSLIVDLIHAIEGAYKYRKG